MSTTKITSLPVLTTPSANGDNTVFVVVDKSSGVYTTKQLTLGNLDLAMDNVAPIALTVATSGYAKANAANVLAQAAFDKANTTNVFTQASYTKANTANITAEAAFAFANTVNVKVDSAFAFANTVNIKVDRSEEHTSELQSH